MRRINGNRCYPCIKYGRDFHSRRFHIFRSLDPVMICVDSHRHGNPQFVTNRIDLGGQVPEVGRTVSVGPPFRFGNLNDDCCIGSLGRFQSPSNHKMISSVGRDGHGVALGDHGPVNNLAAYNQGPGVGKQLNDIWRSSDLKCFIKFWMCRCFL